MHAKYMAAERARNTSVEVSWSWREVVADDADSKQRLHLSVTDTPLL